MRVKEKAYISGRISSQPWEEVKKLFAFGCRYAESKGYEAVSPLAGEKGENWEWKDYMLDDLQKLSECSKMYVLGSPEEVAESYGVQIELLWAKKLGIKIIYIPMEEYLVKVKMKLYTYNGSFVREWTEEFDTKEQRFQYIERMKRGYWRNILEIIYINNKGEITGRCKTTKEDVMKWLR